MPWSNQAPGMSFVGVEGLDMRVNTERVKPHLEKNM